MKKEPGKIMRELRRRHGLTTRQLGKALGYRGKATSLETQIKRWECGQRPIPEQVRILMAYMDAFGIPPDIYKGVR